MAKMRINQLAKEIGRENKDIIDYLKTSKGIEKSHASSVDDDLVEDIKKHFGAASSSVEPKKAEPKAEPEKKVEKAADKGGDKKAGSIVKRVPKRSDTNIQKLETKKPRERFALQKQEIADNALKNAEKENVTTENVKKVDTKPEMKKESVKVEKKVVEKKPAEKKQAEKKQPEKKSEQTKQVVEKSSQTAEVKKENSNNQKNQAANPVERSEKTMKNDPKNNTNDKDAVRSENKSDNKGKNKQNNKPFGNNKNNNGFNQNQQGGKKNKKNKKNQQPVAAQPVETKPVEPVEEEIRTIILPDRMTIKELAEKIGQTPAALIKKLFLEQGIMANLNQEVDFDQAADIALGYNCIAELEEKVDVIEELLKEDDEDPKLMTERPPVVCVMGHVDHGKTSLLDAIRSSNVLSDEAGGITQHIGASVVKVGDKKITFLDTPGHEAFTSMRMRGAQATDIAILVVAADDGVMPQTIEAINHAKAAGIEIIVAVNKIDKPSANVERVKQELMEYELVAEDWGGSTVFCPVSAHTREGIDDLLEMILLTAEVLELKANKNRKARGIVIEGELDKGRGPVATILVQKGTLRVGDSLAVGHAYGKVRAMVDDKGKRVQKAGPSKPVEILGLNDVPMAGEIVVATPNEKEARSMAETFIAYGREKMIADTKFRLSLDDLYDQIQAGNVKELNLVIKADVQGSVEAVKQSLLKLSNEEVVIKVIHGGVGAINESDVILASASNAIIIGFNVRPDVTAKSVAEREKVDVRLYKVIYNAIEDIESAMKGMLDPIYEEKVQGHLEVRQTYKASGVGTIAGSYVLDGLIQKGSTVRVSRDGDQIYEGPLASLKRFKDDAKEVKAGYECGLVFENFNDVKEGDQIEAYTMVEVPR